MCNLGPQMRAFKWRMIVFELRLVEGCKVPMHWGKGACGDAAQEAAWWEHVLTTKHLSPEVKVSLPELCWLQAQTQIQASRQSCGFSVLSRQLCMMWWQPVAQHTSPDSSKNSVLSSEACSPSAHVLLTSIRLTSITCSSIWWERQQPLSCRRRRGWWHRSGVFCLLVQYDCELVVSGSASVLTSPLQISHLQLSVWQPQRGYQPPFLVISHPPKPPVAKKMSCFFPAQVPTRKGLFQGRDYCSPSPSLPLQRTLHTKHFSKAPGIPPWIFNNKSVVHEAPPCQRKDRILL